MKRSMIGTTFFVLYLSSYAALAQTQTVYEIRGQNGTIYSDKPMPGARAIELPSLNVVDFKSVSPATFAPASLLTPARKSEIGKAVAISHYRSFAIVAPEENGLIVAPSAIFEVRLALEPTLLLGEGHSFSVSINGKPVDQHFTASEFMIPPEFWGNTLPPPNQRYQLSARVVDCDGATLNEAAPVLFTLRNEAVRPLAPSPSVRTPVQTQKIEPSPSSLH